MSAALSVLVELRGRGALVHLHRGHVRIEADAESLPEDLIEQAREHRDDLLEELQREVAVDPAPSSNISISSTISLVQDIFPGCRIVREGDPPPTRLFEIEPLPAPVPRQAGEPALDRRDWTGDEWLAVYLERAAVLEYDGGLQRVEAERVALRELGEAWAEQEIDLAFAAMPAAPIRLADFAPAGTAPTGIEVWRCRRCGKLTCSQVIHRHGCSARKRQPRGEGKR